MNLEEYIYQEIDRFLKGELTETEEATFRERMESDPELKKAIELETQVNLAIQYDGRSSLKEKLKGIDQELRSEDGDGNSEEDRGKDNGEKGAEINEEAREFIKSRRGIPWLAVAASILLLIAPLALFQLYMAGSSPQDLVRNAIADANHQVDRASSPELLSISLKAFEKGEYKEAEEALVSYEKEDTIQAFKPGILEYHGLILLRQERPEDAEPYLQRAVNVGNDYPDKYWLLSLCLYQQDKMESCAEALTHYLSLHEKSKEPKIQDHVEIARELLESIQEKLGQ